MTTLEPTWADAKAVRDANPEGGFWCDNQRPHDPHPYTVQAGYGPTLAGQRRTCSGVTREDWQTNLADQKLCCGDLDCPCGPGQVKPGHHGPRGNW